MTLDNSISLTQCEIRGEVESPEIYYFGEDHNSRKGNNYIKLGIPPENICLLSNRLSNGVEGGLEVLIAEVDLASHTDEEMKNFLRATRYFQELGYGVFINKEIKFTTTGTTQEEIKRADSKVKEFLERENLSLPNRQYVPLHEGEFFETVSIPLDATIIAKEVDSQNRLIQDIYNYISMLCEESKKCSGVVTNINFSRVVDYISQVQGLTLTYEGSKYLRRTIPFDITHLRKREFATSISQLPSPFSYSLEIENLALEITKGIDSIPDRSRKIHEWVSANISYDHDAVRLIRQKSALRTFEDRMGRCAESASLYVTMSRLVGDRSFLCLVGEDHAAAITLTQDGDSIFVDTTYREGFNSISDEKVQVIEDSQIPWLRVVV